MSIIAILLVLLWIIGIGFAIFWGYEVWQRREFTWPTFLGAVVGFLTNFFDTLGIGSFAPTTSLFKFFRMAPDEKIPGTLNVGHALPTIVEALIYITVIGVDPVTLALLIVASVLGAWLGAGMVARWPRRYVQIGMGGALTVAAIIFLMQNLKVLPAGGNALGLTGGLLVTGVVINFCLGALMTIGIGLYAPAIIMISLLGMNPRAAFPIMMGSCAFLMPISSVRFVKLRRLRVQGGNWPDDRRHSGRPDRCVHRQVDAARGGEVARDRDCGLRGVYDAALGLFGTRKKGCSGQRLKRQRPRRHRCRVDDGGRRASMRREAVEYCFEIVHRP